MTPYPDTHGPVRGGVGAGGNDCDRPLWEHDRKRVYPDDGPAGTYHYDLECPR